MSKSKNKITFIVNNDFDIPESFNVIRNTDNLPETQFFNKVLAETFNSLLPLNVVALICNNTELINPHTEEIIMSLFEFYSEIGFVYTDALIVNQGVEFIDYFSGLSLPNESFFLNLTVPLQLNNTEQSKIGAMNQLLSTGKTFIHLPDPLIKVYHQL